LLKPPVTELKEEKGEPPGKNIVALRSPTHHQTTELKKEVSVISTGLGILNCAFFHITMDRGKK